MQREIESRGISTVSITLSPEVTERVNPPRALYTPFGLGRPLGPAHDVATQRSVLAQALALLEQMDGGIVDWTPGGTEAAVDRG